MQQFLRCEMAPAPLVVPVHCYQKHSFSQIETKCVNSFLSQMSTSVLHSKVFIYSFGSFQQRKEDMNHVFRIIWNASKGSWAVASELANGVARSAADDQARCESQDRMPGFAGAMGAQACIALALLSFASAAPAANCGNDKDVGKATCSAPAPAPAP